MTNGIEIEVSEVLAELDPLGRALFDLALEKAKNRKLQARVDELERQSDRDAMRGVPERQQPEGADR